MCETGGFTPIALSLTLRAVPPLRPLPRGVLIETVSTCNQGPAFPVENSLFPCVSIGNVPLLETYPLHSIGNVGYLGTTLYSRRGAPLSNLYTAICGSESTLNV